MSIDFSNVPLGTKILELGGGDNPHPQSTCNVDIHQTPRVHFTVDFEQPNWPISSDEWDVVYSAHCIEYISFTKISQFLSEVYRITKPGGKVVFITTNTEAQMEWVRNNKMGWDGRGYFASASEVLFGSQNYDAGSHKCFFSPTIVLELFQKAGFLDIQILPYEERHVDMAIEAKKPLLPEKVIEIPIKVESEQHPLDKPLFATNLLGSNVQQVPSSPKVDRPPPKFLYDRCYFDGGTRIGGYPPPGYLDFPCHEVTARYILARRPQSVIELGCGRGYVLKRIEDAGIQAVGLDVSEHCKMTRASDNMFLYDLLKTPWEIPDPKHHGGKPDLCFSQCFWEHVPEELIPVVAKEMERYSHRGLHGITTQSDGFDRAICSLHPVEWWKERLPKNHEVVEAKILEQGGLPPEVLAGDNKIKIALGGFTTMFHHGWINVDMHELGEYAAQNGYRYQKHDFRTGIPSGTGTVDLIYLPFLLQKFEYLQGLALLRECRRVLKPDGALRLSVPDTHLLTSAYHERRLDPYDHINENCANSPTMTGKLWSILFAGHAMAYDTPALETILHDAGFIPIQTSFRKAGRRDNIAAGDKGVPPHGGSLQIIQETLDLLPCISLTFDAVPAV